MIILSTKKTLGQAGCIILGSSFECGEVLVSLKKLYIGKVVILFQLIYYDPYEYIREGQKHLSCVHSSRLNYSCNFTQYTGLYSPLLHFK